MAALLAATSFTPFLVSFWQKSAFYSHLAGIYYALACVCDLLSLCKAPDNFARCCASVVVFAYILLHAVVYSLALLFCLLLLLLPEQTVVGSG